MGLDIAYHCTIVQNVTTVAVAVPEIMVNAYQDFNSSRDLTTPLSGTVCHPLGTINLYVKFEVSMTTQYEDMKGDRKCKKCGSLG